MASNINRNTGQLQCVGSVADKGRALAGARKVKECFSGADGERLLSEITQDCIARGYRVPLAVKVLRQVKDKETQDTTIALNNVEQLRKKRLWLERSTGVLSEAEYQKQLREGSIV